MYIRKQHTKGPAKTQAGRAQEMPNIKPAQQQLKQMTTQHLQQGNTKATNKTTHTKQPTTKPPQNLLRL